MVNSTPYFNKIWKLHLLFSFFLLHLFSAGTTHRYLACSSAFGHKHCSVWYLVSELVTIKASRLFVVQLITLNSLRTWHCIYFSHKQRSFPPVCQLFYIALSFMQCQNEHSFTSGQTRWGAWELGVVYPQGRGRRGIIRPKIASTCT